MVTAMRSFLRFLRQRGILSIDLAAAMPGVANWRLSHLPKTLPPHPRLNNSSRPVIGTHRQVSEITRSCSLLARLGLRGGEVVVR